MGALAFKGKNVKNFLLVAPFSHLNLSLVALILLPVVLLSVGWLVGGELFSPPLASNVAPETGNDQSAGQDVVQLKIHLIKNLQGSVEMDFNPAGSLLDRLPVVVRAPTLYERQPRQKI